MFPAGLDGFLAGAIFSETSEEDLLTSSLVAGEHTFDLPPPARTNRCNGGPRPDGPPTSERNTVLPEPTSPATTVSRETQLATLEARHGIRPGSSARGAIAQVMMGGGNGVSRATAYRYAAALLLLTEEQEQRLGAGTATVAQLRTELQLAGKLRPLNQPCDRLASALRGASSEALLLTMTVELHARVEAGDSACGPALAALWPLCRDVLASLGEPAEVRN